MFKDMVDLANGLNFIQKVSFQIQFSNRLEKNIDIQQNLINHAEYYQGQACLQVDDYKLKLFNQQIKELLSLRKIEKSFQLQKKYGTGDTFRKLTNLRKAFTDQLYEIQPRPNQYLIILICQSQCSYSKQLWKKIYTFFQRESQNTIKVRCVAILIGQSQKVKQSILKNQWFGEDLFYIENIKCYCQYFAEILLPFMMLVNNEGTIDRINPHYQMRFDHLVDQLLKPKYCKGKESQEKKNLDFEQILQIIDKNEKLLTQKLQQKIKTAPRNKIVVDSNGEMHIKKGSISALFRVFIIAYQEDLQVIQQLKNNVVQCQNVQVQFTEKIILELEVPKTQKCSQCHQKLLQFYYWCYWTQKNNLRCRVCVEGQDSRGFYKFFQNSILVNQSTLKICKNSLGNNLQPQNQYYGSSPQYMCNGCRKCPQYRTARYISLGTIDQFSIGCDFFDFCEQCMINYMNNVKQIRSAIPQNNHAFLRVLYNYDGYYSY